MKEFTFIDIIYNEKLLTKFIQKTQENRIMAIKWTTNNNFGNADFFSPILKYSLHVDSG